MYDLNFYEALSDLNKLDVPQIPANKEAVLFTLGSPEFDFTEDVLQEDDTNTDEIEMKDIKNDLAKLVAKIRARKSILLDADNEDVKEIINAAKDANAKFSGTGKESKWAYQLQLLCNAYISETYILNSLAQGNEFYKNVVRTYTDQRAIAALKSEAAKAAYRKTQKKSTPQLIPTYKSVGFNAPTSHKKIYNEPTDSETDLSNLSAVEVDRRKSDIQMDSLAVEVKVTRSTSAKGFHNADIILICNLANGKIYLKARTAPLDVFVKPADEYDNYTRAVHISELPSDLGFVSAQTNAASFNLVPAKDLAKDVQKKKDPAMEVSEAFEALDNLNEAKSAYSREINTPVDLSTARVVTTDSIDIRGDYERSTCVDYYPKGSTEPVLTRLQVRALVLRNTDEGLKFLGRKVAYRLDLPGGGYDLADGNTATAVARELYEEQNMKLINIEDSGLTDWTYREDPWVVAHVEDPDDRWYGYYSYYLTAWYDGTSDNDNPEELGDWHWYLVTDLSHVKNNIYRQLVALGTNNEVNFQPTEKRTYKRRLDLASEVPGPFLYGTESSNREQYTIPGMLSYCCENPVQLQKIISSNFIKASENLETNFDEREPRADGQRGRTAAVRARYVSFSKQLFSHAYRKPLKWSFGVALDQKLLEQNYKLVDRNTLDRDLYFAGVYQNDPGKYVIDCGTYGMVPVPANIAAEIAKAMIDKSEYHQELSKTDTATLGTPGTSKFMTKQAAWDTEVADDDFSNRFKNSSKQLKDFKPTHKLQYRGQVHYPIQFAIQLHELSPEAQKEVYSYFMNYTYLNEGEVRIWMQEGQEGVKIPTPMIRGIIIPKIIEDYFVKATNFDEAVEVSSEQKAALEFLDDFVATNKLTVFVHDSMDEYHILNFDKTRETSTKGRR